MRPTQKSYVPTHRDFIVEFAPGEYRSALRSLKAFNAGDVLAELKGLTSGTKAYTSVQCGRDQHFELNSDLVYINHSCEPNVAFDMSSPDPKKWHLRALKQIKAGDPLEFFYPSTEWNMDQPFNCECGTPSCMGSIQGAKYLTKKEVLARGFVSPWIVELLEERDRRSPRSQKVMGRL
ncbi:hypothetical protein BJ165DRAFT_1338595 [Panaeolus papilionaceus]|nr:hypothetical protein BJ165DRAFT_1338595 [Panaeolus papilionaceus]